MEIIIGTYQGHPKSHELFKIYFLDLSIDMNDTIGLNLLQLIGVMMSHLLCADGLVLLVLDAQSLEAVINRVHHSCEEWGWHTFTESSSLLAFCLRRIFCRVYVILSNHESKWNWIAQFQVQKFRNTTTQSKLCLWRISMIIKSTSELLYCFCKLCFRIQSPGFGHLTPEHDTPTVKRIVLNLC